MPPDVRCPRTVIGVKKSSPQCDYSQVTYCRVWKKTTETQIRADMESELRTESNSATTNAQPTRKTSLKECQSKEEHYS